MPAETSSRQITPNRTQRRNPATVRQSLLWLGLAVVVGAPHVVAADRRASNRATPGQHQVLGDATPRSNSIGRDAIDPARAVVIELDEADEQEVAPQPYLPLIVAAPRIPTTVIQPAGAPGRDVLPDRLRKLRFPPTIAGATPRPSSDQRHVKKIGDFIAPRTHQDGQLTGFLSDVPRAKPMSKVHSQVGPSSVRVRGAREPRHWQDQSQLGPAPKRTSAAPSGSRSHSRWLGQQKRSLRRVRQSSASIKRR